jgi:hypothetical protein
MSLNGKLTSDALTFLVEANYNGEPRDIPNIYMIRIFSAID